MVEPLNLFSPIAINNTMVHTPVREGTFVGKCQGMEKKILESKFVLVCQQHRERNIGRKRRLPYRDHLKDLGVSLILIKAQHIMDKQVQLPPMPVVLEAVAHLD